MRTMTSIKGAVLAMGVCAAVAMTPNRSEAAVAVDVGFATPVVYGGHYETRHERVLVGGEHHERRWVAPVYDCRHVVVRCGYWEDYCVPARYADRCAQVWIGAPVVHESFGGYYGWGHREEHHREYRHL